MSSYANKMSKEFFPVSYVLNAQFSTSNLKKHKPHVKISNSFTQVVVVVVFFFHLKLYICHL